MPLRTLAEIFSKATARFPNQKFHRQSIPTSIATERFIEACLRLVCSAELSLDEKFTTTSVISPRSQKESSDKLHRVRHRSGSSCFPLKMI